MRIENAMSMHRGKMALVNRCSHEPDMPSRQRRAAGILPC